MARKKDDAVYLNEDAKNLLSKAGIDPANIFGSESRCLQMLFDAYKELDQQVNQSISVIKSSKLSLSQIASENNISRSTINRFGSVASFKIYLDSLISKKIDSMLVNSSVENKLLQKEIEDLHKRDIEYQILKEQVKELENMLQKFTS